MYKNLKNTLQLIGTIPDKNEFDNHCRTLIHNLKSRYNRDELVKYLKNEDLTSKELKIIEEACFITKDNELFSSIKGISTSNQKILDFKKTLDWFKTPQCFNQVFRSKDINGISTELIDFFEKFTRNILPSINSENYATIYTYIASGNMEKDFFEKKYENINNDSFLSETILNNAKKHLIPIKMIGDDFSNNDIIIENNSTDMPHLNKTNQMAKSSYIDVVMISPDGKNLFISNVTSNTTSSDNNEHFEKRIKYNKELINISKKNNLNLIQCDFYKPELIKNHSLKENIGNDNVEKLFYYINVFPHKIENFVNNTNYDIFLMGADVDKNMLKNNDIYEDFNEFINIIMTFEDEFSDSFKLKIKDSLKVNTNLIMKAINTEYTEYSVDSFKSKINKSTLDYVAQSFKVPELNEVSFKLLIPSEYLVEHNLSVYNNSSETFKKHHKKTMSKNEFLSFFNEKEKRLIEKSINYFFNFMDDANNFNEVGDPNKTTQTRLLPSSVYKKLLKNECPPCSIEYQELYESFILFNKLGFNKNKLGYSNEDIVIKGHELKTLLKLTQDNLIKSKDPFSDSTQSIDFNIVEKIYKYEEFTKNENYLLRHYTKRFFNQRENELKDINKEIESFKFSLKNVDIDIPDFLQKKLNSIIEKQEINQSNKKRKRRIGF